MVPLRRCSNPNGSQGDMSAKRRLAPTAGELDFIDRSNSNQLLFLVLRRQDPGDKRVWSLGWLIRAETIYRKVAQVNRACNLWEGE
jgi:hypothetical protein